MHKLQQKVLTSKLPLSVITKVPINYKQHNVPENVMKKFMPDYKTKTPDEIEDLLLLNAEAEIHGNCLTALVSKESSLKCSYVNFEKKFLAFRLFGHKCSFDLLLFFSSLTLHTLIYQLQVCNCLNI